MAEHEQTQPGTRTGFNPFTVGQDVYIERGGGAFLIARRNMHVSRGGGQWLVALGDQTIDQGGGAVLVSREARVSNGLVGVALAGRLSLEGNARALVSIRLPILAAVAAGFALGLVFSRLDRRRATTPS